jgi:hypothetical protein
MFLLEQIIFNDCPIPWLIAPSIAPASVEHSRRLLYYDIRSYITTPSRRQKSDTLKTTSWFLKAIEAWSLELVIHSWMCELQWCSNTISLFSYPRITWQISFIYIYISGDQCGRKSLLTDLQISGCIIFTLLKNWSTKYKTLYSSSSKQVFFI